MTSKRLLDEAAGYRTLGLNGEAEVALCTVIENHDGFEELARSSLIFLLNDELRFSEAAAMGLDQITRGCLSVDGVIGTMLALNFLGRIQEARNTLLLLDQCGGSLEAESYQMACFAARLGDYSEALRYLTDEFRRSTEYHSRVLVDTDFTDFWSWLEHHQPTLEEAHWIVETPFESVCTAARSQDAAVGLAPNDLNRLPDRCRALFRHSFEVGFFVPNATAAAHDPAAMAEWVSRHAAECARIDQILVSLHQRAGDLVLAAQPRYAAQHAAWGNHHGARQHILWGLRYAPHLLREFLMEPGLELMEPLLVEIVNAGLIYREFCRELRAVLELMKSDPEGAFRLLEDIPPTVRNTGLFQLTLGLVLHARRDYELALPVWAELRRLWPCDAAGFGNAINALQMLGRADEARQLLAAAPPCFRHFHLYWTQHAQLHHGIVLAPPPPGGRFRGNPTMIGVLLSPVKAAVHEAQRGPVSNL